MWYAVQVFTGDEEKVKRICELLIDSSCYTDIFVIRFNRAKKFYGKWHKESKIMFPGYLFIDTDEPLMLYESLRNIPQFTKVLGRDMDEFIPIEESKESLFKSMVNNEYEIDISKGIITGDTVVITEGPLVGKEAMIKKIDRHKRTAILSINMFGRETDITVGLEIVAKE